MATPRFINTSDCKIAGKRSVKRFGAQGADEENVVFGANDLFPPSTLCTLIPENVYKELGQVGLKGQKLPPIIVGQNVAGGFEGDFHYNSDPILTAIATLFGEAEESVGGGLYDHKFYFSQNFHDESINDFSGSVQHHMHVAVHFGEHVFQYNSFKGNTLEITFDRDEGIKFNIQGHAFSGSSLSGSAISTSAWTQRESDYTQDLALISNTGDLAFYMTEYATDTTVSESDLIQGISDISFNFDQANEVKPTSATRMGIDEPRRSANGAEAAVTFTIMYGHTDAYYGRRYWGNAYVDGTKVQIYAKVTGPNGQQIEIKIPCGFIQGGAIPVISSATGEEIGCTITVVGRIANTTLTNTFQGLGKYSAQMVMRNTRSGMYLGSLE